MSSRRHEDPVTDPANSQQITSAVREQRDEWVSERGVMAVRKMRECMALDRILLIRLDGDGITSDMGAWIKGRWSRIGGWCRAAFKALEFVVARLRLLLPVGFTFRLPCSA